MHEISGKRVEVKGATPKGSGPQGRTPGQLPSTLGTAVTGGPAAAAGGRAAMGGVLGAAGRGVVERPFDYPPGAAAAAAAAAAAGYGMGAPFMPHPGAWRLWLLKRDLIHSRCRSRRRPQQ